MSKTYRVQWARAAIEDVDEILEYIAAQQSVDAAQRVYSRILVRINTLSTHPRRCRIVPELKEFGIMDYRELIVRPYRVFFRIVGLIVGIIGVLDGRRDLEALLLDRALQPPEITAEN